MRQEKKVIEMTAEGKAELESEIENLRMNRRKEVAQKIKEVAKENDIPIVENKPLARMLYHNVEIDEEIPEELYQMTAEVLAYVYSLKEEV